MSDRLVPIAFALKQDFETADDAQLARLEIEGLCGEAVFSPADRPAGEWEPLLGLLPPGTQPDQVLLSSVEPSRVPTLARRLAMSAAVAAGTGDEAVCLPTVQAVFESAAINGGAGLSSHNRRKNEYLSHAFHKYKAKFFPRMARSLLNYTTPRGGTALDPFAGSGTLNVEAALMGVESVGLDIDPLSVFIARTKVDALSLPTTAFAHSRDELLTRLTSRGVQTSLYDLDEPPDSNFRLPDFLGKKMPDDRAGIERDVAWIKSLIATEADERARAILTLALSHALSTKISLRWMGTGDNRFALSIAKRSVPQLMAGQLKRMLAGLAQRDALVDQGALALTDFARASIAQGDVRASGLDADSFEGVVTSPPYLPASSGRETYLRSRAPSLVALDFLTEQEVLEQDQAMIGSILRRLNGQQTVLPESIEQLVDWMRPQRARAPKAEPTAVYFHDLAVSLKEIGRVLRPGGRMAMVVSNEHVFYDLVSREIVRRLYMPETIAELVAEPRNEIPLEIERVVKIELPKMDYAARPASRESYSEAIVIAKRI